MLSGGLVNPFKVIGYIFVHSYLGDFLTSQKRLWTLLVAPLPAAAILVIVYMYFYYGRLEANNHELTSSPLSVVSD